MELPVRQHSSGQDSKQTEVTPPKRLEKYDMYNKKIKLTSLDKLDKKHMGKKYINRELQHQKTNLETVSMLSFGQLLMGLEVRS